MLWEFSLRLPDSPRILICLRLPHELERDLQAHVVVEREATLGQRGVPVQAVLAAIDVASSSTPILSFPAMSTCGPTRLPRPVTVCVLPLIVRSPVTSSSPASPTDSEVEVNVIRGWLALSKKSGDLRCPARFSSLTWIESTSTEPVRTGVPSAPAERPPVYCSKRPRNVATTMCFTANPTVEWTGSILHLPAAMFSAVAVLMWANLLCSLVRTAVRLRSL